MASVSQLLNKPHGVRQGLGAQASIGERIRVIAEYLWIAVTFILFMVLGPFAAIAVIPAVFSLALKDNDNREPEMLVKEG